MVHLINTLRLLSKRAVWCAAARGGRRRLGARRRGDGWRGKAGRWPGSGGKQRMGAVRLGRDREGSVDTGPGWSGSAGEGVVRGGAARQGTARRAAVRRS